MARQLQPPEQPTLGPALRGANPDDPSTGTWTQQDTYNAPLDPNNANRYTYTGGDPTNRLDPTGRESYLGCAVAYAGVLAFVFTVPGSLSPEGLIGGASAFYGMVDSCPAIGLDSYNTT